MAVQNYLTNYAPSQDASGVPEKWAIEGHGVRKAFIQNSVTIVNGDSIGSTYIIAKDVPAAAILSEILIETDAITSCTQCNVGIYDSTTGVAYTAQALAAATLDIHTAVAKQPSPLDGMPVLTHELTKQEIYKLAGHTLNQARGTYDIVMALTQAATAGGVVTFRTEILPSG